MFFLLRSAFWLGLVFYAMPWEAEAPGALPLRASLSAEASDMAAKALKLTSEKVQTHCKDRLSECLNAASAAQKWTVSEPSASMPALRPAISPDAAIKGPRPVRASQGAISKVKD